MQLLSWQTLFLVVLIINSLLVADARPKKHVITNAASDSILYNGYQPAYNPGMNAMDQQRLNKFYSSYLG